MVVCIVIIGFLVVLSAFPMGGCSKIVSLLSRKTIARNNQTQYQFQSWYIIQNFIRILRQQAYTLNMVVCILIIEIF